LDFQEKLQKGTPYAFRVRLADSDNEKCEISQRVTATLTMIKSQSPVPVTVICETLSQYAVSFTTSQSWLDDWLCKYQWYHHTINQDTGY